MLDGRPHTVIGVMPQGFQFPIQTEPIEMYITLAEDASSPDGSTPYTQQRGSHSLLGIARLKRGVWPTQANAELRTMNGRVRLCPYYFVEVDRVRMRGALATIVPADKKLIHGMRDGILAPSKQVD